MIKTTCSGRCWPSSGFSYERMVCCTFKLSVVALFFQRRLLVRYWDYRNSLFSFNVTLHLLHLPFLLRLRILNINLYNITGSLILRAEIPRRLKLLSFGSVITLIGVVKGEKHAVGCECVRADVAIGNSL